MWLPQKEPWTELEAPSHQTPVLRGGQADTWEAGQVAVSGVSSSQAHLQGACEAFSWWVHPKLQPPVQKQDWKLILTQEQRPVGATPLSSSSSKTPGPSTNHQLCHMPPT